MTEAEWLSSEDPHALLKHVAARPRSWTTRLAGWLGLGAAGAIDRKMRLVAVACCRRIWQLIVDPRARLAIEVCERSVDGAASKKEWNLAVAAAVAAVTEASGPRLALSRWSSAARTRAAEAVASAVSSQNPAHDAAAHAREAMRALAMDVAADKPKGTAQPAAPASEISWMSNVSSWPDLTAEDPSTVVKKLEAAAQAAWLAERCVQANLVRDVFGNPFQPIAISRVWATPKVVALARNIYDQRSFEWLPELTKALEEANCSNAGLLSHCRSTGEHVRGCWAVDALLGKCNL